MNVYKTEEWSEEHGDCLFLHFYNFEESPRAEIKSPLDTCFDENYWTHFVELPLNEIMEAVINESN